MIDPDIEKSIDETFKENTPELPEAPMSITIKGYYKGFSVLLTKRMDETQLAPQIVKVMGLVDTMIANGYKPSWNDDTNGKMLPTIQTAVQTPQAAPPAYVCKVCGSPASFKEGNKNGKHWSGYFCTADKEHVTWGK
jgi:hypothetical protein